MYTLDQIKELAPSVFTTDKAPHLTDKYVQTPTSRVVGDLMSLGWQVTKCQEEADPGHQYPSHSNPVRQQLDNHP